MLTTDKPSPINTAKPQPKTGGLAGVPGMVAAAATAFMLLTQPIGAQTAPTAATKAVSLATPEFATGSKGKILLVVSRDFPPVGIKFFIRSMEREGLSVETSTSEALPSKKAALYIDGQLIELKFSDDPATTQIDFASMGIAASALKHYIRDNKVELKGPVASP